MSKGSFTDKRHRPTNRDIAAVLGRSGRSWNEFVAFVEKTFGVKGDWRFYGINYGWALRFRQKGKALISLYPAVRSYTAQLILDERVVDRTRTMKISKAIRAAIEAAHPYPEGRWVFLAVTSRSLAAEARQLLLLKSGRLESSPRRPSPSPAPR